MEQFIQSLLELGNFSQVEINAILSRVKTKHLAKNDFVLKEGQVCQVVQFVNKGSLRQFYVSEQGTENTINLLIEKDWVLDYQSFTSQKPSINNIQAFEVCELFELGVYDMHALIEQSSKFFMIGKLLQNGLQPMQVNGNFYSPEEKYQQLLIRKPGLVQKFPLTLIASYLGMAPETLSRVRRKIKIQSR